MDAPPLHELIGKNVFDVFPAEVAKLLWENDVAALEAKQPVYSEEVVKHKDGEWHTYLTVKFPIFLRHDEPFGTCAISNDLSARKKAEQEKERLQTQITQIQKMESIGRLAGGIAHDSNNMLGIILGQTELALKSATANQELTDHLHTIQVAAERSAGLTQQLLARSSHEAFDADVFGPDERAVG